MFDRTHNLYKPYLKKYAQELRKNSTLAEVLLWKRLRGKQLLNYTFLRQRPINDYIVDFYCPELKLIIEIDGWSHDFKIDHDQTRQECLEELGLNVLRFQDHEVKNDIEIIIQRIVDWIDGHASASHPPPLPRGRI